MDSALLLSFGLLVFGNFLLRRHLRLAQVDKDSLDVIIELLPSVRLIIKLVFSDPVDHIQCRIGVWKSKCSPRDSVFVCVHTGQKVYGGISGLHNLMELWILVLALYFEQDNQRICRCDYCWGNFIPKTKKVTRYCDRVTNGQRCKQRGANLARLDKTSEDEALLIYKKLRDRMYARLLRWIDAAPSERSNLTPMDYEQYDQWSENARLAREEYVQGKLTAEEFLRKIDTTHELTNYEVDKIDLPDEPSLWQRLVERDFRFDPERYFPEKMARLNLSDPDPQWQILTADDLRREAQTGHQSLKEKYGN